MIKLLKELYKYNGLSLSNTPKLKTKLKTIRMAFSSYSIDLPLRTDLDYFDASIAYQGLLNKQAFETVFQDQWVQLSDLWSHLSYQEKNKLIQIPLTEVKNQLPYFSSESGKVIWIPFFNELLNTLYHSDLAIFELEQYYKLFKNFSSNREDRHHYGFLPFKSRFIEITPLFEKEGCFYFYDQDFKSIFRLNSKFEMVRLPLNKEACTLHPLKKDLTDLAKAFHSENWVELAKLCLMSPLIHSKTKILLEKRLKKNENI